MWPCPSLWCPACSESLREAELQTWSQAWDPGAPRQGLSGDRSCSPGSPEGWAQAGGELERRRVAMARGSLRAHVGHPLLTKPPATGWLCSKFPAVTLLGVGQGACGETVLSPSPTAAPPVTHAPSWPAALLEPLGSCCCSPNRPSAGPRQPHHWCLQLRA